MTDDFYRSFEERYYAPRELIKKLRRQYLPFVQPLVAVYPGAPTFDIGCGRGEWLELMGEIGFKAYGVDLDEGMLGACMELGLPASRGDAVAHLASLPDESQAVVSAFHVVEHITFEQLRSVVSNALRVLKPGALLIMETPNPENIIVATKNFYLDPTHQRPIPPQLLAFVTEYAGFKRNKVLRLQESVELTTNPAPSLLGVLSGASPDYAVVAQKDGLMEAIMATEPAFEIEYGLTMETLANRYQTHTESREALAGEQVQRSLEIAHQAQVLAQQAEIRAQQAEAREVEASEQARRALETARLHAASLIDVTNELEQIRAELQKVHHSDQHHLQLAEARQHQFDTLLNSSSWRITAPLRAVSKAVRWFSKGTVAWLTLRPGSRPRRTARRAVKSAGNYILSKPLLAYFAKKVLRRFPAIETRLRPMILTVAARSWPLAPIQPEVTPSDHRPNESLGGERLDITPRSVGIDLESIDRFLTALDAAKDDDELRQIFETYNAEYDLNLPTDPTSEAYRAKQFMLYEKLYGHPYSSAHERTHFDVQGAARSPFPYCHGSWSTVSGTLIGIGYLIKCMALPKGARILELGPGWGNTTIALAKMGYQVTAFDIEPNFVELIKERARMEGITSIDVSVGDFSALQSVSDPFDAVLFFECFHHAADHLALIGSLERAVKPDGLVCFGAEPITPDFPIPWGLRMDGQSLWAIRKNGWLELGYNLFYFKEVMLRHGWRIIHFVGHESPWANAIIARRLDQPLLRWHFSTGGLQTQIGTINGSVATATGKAGFLIFGPYVDIPPGEYAVSFELVDGAEAVGQVRLEVTADSGKTLIESRTLQLMDSNAVSALVLPFVAHQSLEAVEFRLNCETGARLSISEIQLR